MAMEIKTLDVKNSEEAATIEFWQQFGWVLKSSQRVYSKDSHLETRGDSTYSVTETVDFTKLVFERDKNGPHYAEIVSLENEYFYSIDELGKAEKEETAVRNRWKAQENRMDFRTQEQKQATSRAKKKALIPLISGGTLALVGLAPVSYGITVVPTAVVVPCIVVGLSALALGIILLSKASSKARACKSEALAMAKQDIQSESGKVYQAEYEKFALASSEAISKRDFYKKRIPEILDTLDTLI